MRRLPLALSGLVLAASLTACSSDGLDAGTVVRAQDGAIDTDATGTREVSLQLPEGRLTVTVSDPLPDVPADDTLGDDDLEPADGTELRAVTWIVTTEGTTTAGRALGGLGTAPGSLELDGVVIDDRWQRTGAAYVLVPSGDAPKVSMDFDGLTQSVDVATGDRDVPAAAQPLYDKPSDPVGTPCADLGGTDGFVAQVSCRIETSAAPYASGTGWADTPWHVVDLSVTLANVKAADGTTYDIASAGGTATLDGTEPAGTADTPDTEPSGLGDVVLVFDGSLPAKSLEVSRTFQLTKQSGPGPDSASYTVSSVTPLP